MLDGIILFSIRNKLIIALLTIALIVWGGYSLTQLPIDAVPDITNNQVQVITRSPALAAHEVERFITFPIETACSTIPGRVEIRSISRFGLSVVTIVFDDNIDVYWARQQVTERMKEAETQIPATFGVPELAPVTTGLGEIYQYVIRPQQGYEKHYSIMQLRSVQDWIVRRQLLGTKGVADVSSFGGFVKQYEIALNPDKLRAMNVSISEVFTALERNNQNAGGAYIDKKPNAYFIRTEGLVGNVEDIGSIVIKTPANAVPVLIRDVAVVQLGSAIRYGAMTYTDADTAKSGEVVGGLVLMLKGENSSTVIANVKKRVAEIQKTLPEGLIIESFLDRTKLVNAAIATVVKNLAEGALIVVFVLVLFLGNLRAGLVVASMIPLAMLFAIAMMNVFGVSGNLMSLGAIDFGLIVDGAVIIVEATLHHLAIVSIPMPAQSSENSTTTSEKKKPKEMTQAQMDNEVYDAASKIRSSAAFGEIIILIVYLPILVLSGVEGKMFKPMAQTVAFAILGAFILSLTYIPMMSALGLSKRITHGEGFAERMIERIQVLYQPILRGALRQKIVVLAGAVAALVLSLVLFLRMGGEFIPTLDEGDFAVETRTMTGSSLSYTTDIALQASRLLKKQFPEVQKVVGKIGTSEIPTDPMPLESCDLMIILSDKNTWTTAHNREELATKMQSALETLPGVEFGFQQPIQMRFNELMTGARQDVVLKIYGENLDVLAAEASRIGALATTIPGAEDVFVEKVTGLPQIVVSVNRSELARFGAAVSDINQAVRMAFAGETAGIILENEQRYDLVVRLDTAHRKTIEDVRNLLVTTPAGQHVPLSQLASVEMRLGPNQIQRDNVQRRIVIGFNVRNRDVETVVADMRRRIEERVKLPAGYYIVYGGSFENLQQAKMRLAVAVPIALALIFVLLYFTFGSITHSLLIFTAIPLSAIGGVVALWLRGMPFSISAGIGFIALFGVSVLNGIVLIGYFQRLKNEGERDVMRIVLTGTAVRLRPVLMTAAVASLGFLPMALSNSSGAEVQKPLATVVIGGLISATLLTLFVLPVLYVLAERFLEKQSSSINNRIKPDTLGCLLCIAFVGNMFATPTSFAQTNFAQTSSVQTSSVQTSSVQTSSVQTSSVQMVQRVSNSNEQVLTLEQAIELAVRNHPALRAERLEIALQRALKATSTDIGKTQAAVMFGQYNSFAQDNSFTVSQTLPFPTVFTAKAALGEAATEGAERRFALTRNDLVRDVKTAYYHCLYVQQREELLQEQDTIFVTFATAAAFRTKTGEARFLEQSSAALQAAEARLQLRQIQSDQQAARAHLATLVNSAFPDNALYRLDATTPRKRSLSPFVEQVLSKIFVPEAENNLLVSDSVVNTRNPGLAYFRQQILLARSVYALEAARILPDITVGWFSQTLIGTQESGRIAGTNDRFSGVQIGLSIPLWIAPQLAGLEAAALAERIAEANTERFRVQLWSEYAKAVRQYQKFRTTIAFYEEQALSQAQTLLANARISYTKGDIGYLEYAQMLHRALSIRANYVQSLWEYNQAIIALEHLFGAE